MRQGQGIGIKDGRGYGPYGMGYTEQGEVLGPAGQVLPAIYDFQPNADGSYMPIREPVMRIQRDVIVGAPYNLSLLRSFNRDAGYPSGNSYGEPGDPCLHPWRYPPGTKCVPEPWMPTPEERLAALRAGAEVGEVFRQSVSIGGVDPVSNDLSDKLFDDWVAMAKRLGVNPIDIARVGFSETGMHPHINGGLIGFVPSTLHRLGWTGTAGEFWALRAEDQVPYVERYYAPYAPWMKNDGLAYVANYTPAYLRAAAASGSDSFIVARKGDGIYDGNEILDRNHDGIIDVGDLKRHLDIQVRGSRWTSILRRLKDAGAHEPGKGGGVASSSVAKVIGWTILLGSVGAVVYAYRKEIAKSKYLRKLT